MIVNVCGVGSSGATCLAAVLDRHAQIACGGERYRFGKQLRPGRGFDARMQRLWTNSERRSMPSDTAGPGKRRPDRLPDADRSHAAIPI